MRVSNLQIKMLGCASAVALASALMGCGDDPSSSRQNARTPEGDVKDGDLGGGEAGKGGGAGEGGGGGEAGCGGGFTEPEATSKDTAILPASVAVRNATGIESFVLDPSAHGLLGLDHDGNVRLSADIVTTEAGDRVVHWNFGSDFRFELNMTHPERSTREGDPANYAVAFQLIRQDLLAASNYQWHTFCHGLKCSATLAACLLAVPACIGVCAAPPWIQCAACIAGGAAACTEFIDDCT